MTRIHTVVFDLGGVLVHLDEAPLLPLLAPGLDADAWWRFIVAHPEARRFETGQLDAGAFARAAAAVLRDDVDDDAFLDAFHAWCVGAYPGAREVVDSVRRHGLATAVLSNTNALHWGMHVERGVATWFDTVVTSHEVGALKPDDAIFAALEARARGPVGGLFFLDDNTANVDAGRRRGWQAERVRGIEEVRAVLAHRALVPAEPP